jgi:hypothetical protein
MCCMEFSFDIPDVFFSLLLPCFLLAVLVGAGLLYLWPHSATGRDRRVQRWAAENLVALTPETAAAADTALTFRNRLVGAAILLTAALAGPSLFFPTTGEGPSFAPWSVAIAVGILITVAQSVQLTRPWFAAGATRAARLRPVTLEDYVARPLRWSAWLSGAVCLFTVVIGSVSAESPIEAAIRSLPSLGVLAALAVAEWTGRRAAERPQPARDAAELYAQDAWRTGSARYGFQGIALWGGIATTFQTWNYALMPVAESLLRLFGYGLIVLSAVAVLLPYPPITWTRRRLWPGLAAGEAVGAEAVTL